MPTSLETSFATICREHDLTGLYVGYHKSPSAEFWSANAHWSPASKPGRSCTQGLDTKSLQRAVDDALVKACAARTPAASKLADEALPVAEIA